MNKALNIGVLTAIFLCVTYFTITTLISIDRDFKACVADSNANIEYITHKGKVIHSIWSGLQLDRNNTNYSYSTKTGGNTNANAY